MSELLEGWNSDEQLCASRWAWTPIGVRSWSSAPGEPAACQHAAMASATAPRTPCWHCKHMISIEPRSTIVNCGRPAPGSRVTFSRGGWRGCDDWEREPGIDDDDWDPVGVPVIGASAPEPPPAPWARSTSRDGWWTETPRPRRPAAPMQVVPILVPARDPFGALFNWQDD